MKNEIPVEQQSLRAASSNWWTLGFTRNRSGSLPNDENVKDMMNQYNTDFFEVKRKEDKQ
jgi:hypothetical protein